MRVMEIVVQNVYAASDSTVKITGVGLLSLSGIISFVIKLIFSIAALVAFYYLLSGAFMWISSGGDKENITEARGRIQSAVVGLILIVAVVSIAVTLEKFVFRENICFGLSCPIRLPSLRDRSVSPAGGSSGQPPMIPQDDFTPGTNQQPVEPTNFIIPTAPDGSAIQ